MCTLRRLARSAAPQVRPQIYAYSCLTLHRFLTASHSIWICPKVVCFQALYLFLVTKDQSSE